MARRILVVLVLCLIPTAVCLAQQGDADQPATAADVERYYQAVHVRETMQTTMAAVTKQLRQMMHDQLEKAPNLPPGAEDQMDKMYDTVLAKMPVDDLLKAMEPVYEKHFTKDDIDSIVAFYSTPTGHKMITEMPAVTQESMQAAYPVIQKYMTDTMQQVHDRIEEMQKNNKPDPNKPVTTN